MNIVQPLRTQFEIEEMKNQLLKINQRDYLLFIVGINTGLRIGDILKLKVSDIKDKSHIVITEQKTNKIKRFLINQYLKIEIDKFIKHLPLDDFLFKSRNGKNQPITRIQAYRILNNAATIIGIDEIGCHTTRKSFGYWHYQQFKDIAILQDIFNHSAPSITMRYIGINDDLKDKTIENFYL